MKTSLLAFTLFTSACSNTNEVEPTSSNPPQIKDATDKTTPPKKVNASEPYDPFVSYKTELDKTPVGSAADKKAIVALGGNITETLYALGLEDKIAGVDMTSKYPPEAAGKPQVGYFRRVSAEGEGRNIFENGRAEKDCAKEPCEAA